MADSAPGPKSPDNLFLFPIRYYSFTPVAREYQNKPALPDSGSLELSQVLCGLADAKSEISALTPYLFVLFETENGRPCWQYIDLAGNLSLLRFTDEADTVLCEKISVGSGFCYKVREVRLRRNGQKA